MACGSSGGPGLTSTIRVRSNRSAADQITAARSASVVSAPCQWSQGPLSLQATLIPKFPEEPKSGMSAEDRAFSASRRSQKASITD